MVNRFKIQECFAIKENRPEQLSKNRRKLHKLRKAPRDQVMEIIETLLGDEELEFSGVVSMFLQLTVNSEMRGGEWWTSMEHVLIATLSFITLKCDRMPWKYYDPLHLAIPVSCGQFLRADSSFSAILLSKTRARSWFCH